MTARSQIEKIRQEAGRAARIARRSRRLDHALEDVAIDLQYAVDTARSRLRTLDLTDIQVEEELSTQLVGLLDDSERRHQRTEDRDVIC
jgi:hypothetical protein